MKKRSFRLGVRESKYATSHSRIKAELAVCGGRGLLIGPKTALLISYVFTAILSLMKHVNTFHDRYLPKEAFF